MNPAEVSEAYIETRLKAELLKVFGITRFLYLKFKAVNFNGVPDRLILLSHHRIYFIELKRPKGGVLSPVQLVVHKLFGLLGSPVRVIWTVEQLELFILEIKKL